MCTGLEFLAGAGAAGGGGLSFGTLFSIVSTGFKVFSAISEGNAADEQAQQNAQIDRQNAEQRRQKTAFDEKRLRKQMLLAEGANRARAGAAGGNLLDAQDVFDDFSEESELDALALRYSGEVEARGFEQQASVSELQGKLAKRKAFTKAGGSLLTGFGKMVTA
jgi:hypothetical protein